MRVVPEEVLLDLLGRCLKLSLELHPHLSNDGSAPAAPALVQRHRELVDELHRQKRHDSVLSDESWEWIWETPESVNHFQLYGRLAWLNYSLFNLL
jgi:hypothetical protein